MHTAASARVHSRLERLEGTEQRERSAARQGGVYGHRAVPVEV